MNEVVWQSLVMKLNNSTTITVTNGANGLNISVNGKPRSTDKINHLHFPGMWLILHVF